MHFVFSVSLFISLQLFLCDCCAQSEDEDLDIAPQQTGEGFTFDPNVQMPEDGFQL
jgi:hypothetical protein